MPEITIQVTDEELSYIQRMSKPGQSEDEAILSLIRWQMAGYKNRNGNN